MRRRTFLQGALLAAGLGAAGAAGPSRERLDYRVEELGLRSSSLLTRARHCYREWLEGRLDSPRAATQLQALSSQLQALHRSLPASQQPLLNQWSAEQRGELAFLLGQARAQRAAKSSSAELQRRWLAALGFQRRWLQARRERIAPLAGGASRVGLQQFYQWRYSLLPLLEAELDIAADLARAFLDPEAPAVAGVRRALSLHGRAQSLRPAPFLAEAHALFLERFAALTRLADSAEQMRQDPGADGAANLQADEEAYNRLALRGEQAALEVLRRQLG